MSIILNAVKDGENVFEKVPKPTKIRYGGFGKMVKNAVDNLDKGSTLCLIASECKDVVQGSV